MEPLPPIEAAVEYRDTRMKTNFLRLTIVHIYSVALCPYCMVGRSLLEERRGAFPILLAAED